MNILVLDIGTSSMRGVLYDEDGHTVFTHQVKYSVHSTGKNVEQSPTDWENALVEICRMAVRRGYPIGALSMTSQRSSVIPVDRDGIPLRNAIMWQDTRNAEIVESLAPYAERITALTGARLNTVFSGTKMTWFRRNEPEKYDQTYKLCTIADYLTFLITGEFVTDETYGSRSLLMGIRSRKWEPELLETFEVEQEKLCRIVAPGSVSGTVTREFAEKTGIPADVPLISAGGDQQCGALGQGIFSDGALAVTFGTSACLLKHARSVPDNLKGVICGAHAIPGNFVLEGSMLTCGAMFDWVRRTLFMDSCFTIIERLIRTSPPGANGITVIPHFQGRGTPDWNSTVRGGFLNLSLGTTQADIARAALESIVYEIVNNIETMETLGGISDTIHVGGGFTRNAELCRILADASGKTVVRGKENTEDTAFGAWMSAAVTLALYPNYAAAFENLHVSLERTKSNPEYYDVYRRARERMNNVYTQLYGT